MIKTKDDAKTALADVNGDVLFYLCDGTTLKNIFELKSALKTMIEDVYIYHANSDRNDFAAWVNDIIKDDVLARKLIGKKRKEAIKCVEERTSWLKKKAK